MILSIAKRFSARSAIEAAPSADERKKARKTGRTDGIPPEL